MKYLPIFAIHFIGADEKVPILCNYYSADPYIRKHTAEDFILDGLKRYASIRNWSYRDFEEKSNEVIEVVKDYLYNNSLRDKACDPLHIVLDNEQDSLIIDRANIIYNDGWVSVVNE